MMDIYRHLFDAYLKDIYSRINDSRHYCVTMCNKYREQLNGMLTLMFYANVITDDGWKSELENLRDTFDSRKICGAYQVIGEIYECKNNDI